jgi:hypothetical protein
MFRIRLELFPQTGDLRVDRPLIGVPPRAMGHVHQLLAAENAAGIFQENCEEFEFATRQLDIQAIRCGQLATIRD